MFLVSPVQLEDADLIAFSRCCHAHPEEFETLKNACANIVAVCGIWDQSERLADLAVAITQSVTMKELGHEKADRRITVDTVCQVHPFQMGFDHLARLPLSRKELLTEEVELAEKFLRHCVWDDSPTESLMPDAVYELWITAHDALADALMWLNLNI